MFVRTERLFLRPGWPEDLDELMEAFNDPAIQRTVGVAPLPQTRAEIAGYLRRERDPLLPHFFAYLREHDGAQLVGGIGLGRHGDEVEIGYWIGARYRGRGFAFEALRAVIDQARALGHRKLVAKHFIDNAGTVRVLEAAGFHDTGSDVPRYSQARGGESLARRFEIDLTRLVPVGESSGQALSA